MQGPAPHAAAACSVRSIGCQTNEDPLFPPMQAGLLGARPHLCLSLCSSGIPTLHTHTRTQTHTHTHSSLSVHP